jgi:hypothetical protein
VPVIPAESAAGSSGWLARIITTSIRGGAVALAGGKTRLALEALRSEGMGEFGEGSRKSMPRVELNAVFVVAAAEILHERVPGADDSD